MAGFWGRRKREEQDAADADLARRAELAIVAADERVRLTSDELDFARAELGDKATEDLAAALESVKTHLAEAFQLHQLNHDEIPDTAEELRTRNARIIQLSKWAEDLLEERTLVLQPKIDAVRRAQRRYGLNPVGTVGAQTVAMLNVPVAQRIRQILANMEPKRWWPQRR